MKNIATFIIKGACLAGFAAVLLVLVAGNCDAAEKTKPAAAEVLDYPSTMDGAIAAIEQRVIAATLKGDTAAASSWSQTLLAEHASRYVGPIGDMLASFKEAGKKLPEIIAVMAEVEAASVPENVYDSHFSQMAALAAFRGEVDRFGHFAVCDKLWRAATAEARKSYSGDPNAEQRQSLLTLRNWIDGGCKPGHLPQNMADEIAKNQVFQSCLAAYRSQLTAAN